MNWITRTEEATASAALEKCRQIQNLRRTRELPPPPLLSGQVELETEAA